MSSLLRHLREETHTFTSKWGVLIDGSQPSSYLGSMGPSPIPPIRLLTYAGIL